MRKLQVLCITLFALFAFGVIAASSAFAEGEWLVENQALLEGLLAETVGEILLVAWETEALLKVLNEFKCSGIFHGLIGPGAADLIEELLTLGSLAVGGSTLAGGLVGTGLVCEVTFDGGALTDCKTGATEAKLWPENLPWSTELELMGTSLEPDLLDKILGPDAEHEPGWEVECTSLFGIKGEELCEALPGKASTLLQNEPSGTPSVLGWFLPESDEELGLCTMTNEHTGEVVSDVSGDTWAVTGSLETKLATSVVE